MTYNVEISILMVHMTTIYSSNLQASDGLQDGDIIFDGPHDYGVFELNLPASEQQQEMHQMISNAIVNNL